MSGRVASGWWRRNRVALLASPLVLGAVGWVAGRPLIDRWREDDGPDRTVAVGEPFEWAGATFALRAVVAVPEPLDDGEPFMPPPGTVVWQTSWTAGGPDDQTGLGCQVTLVDDAERTFAADPIELNRLGLRFGCSPGFEDDPTDYRYDRYFLLPAGAEPATVRFAGFGGDDVAITLD